MLSDTHQHRPEATVETAGLVDGADILTMTGYVPVASLMAGDRVITRRGVRVLRGVTVHTAHFRAVLIGPSTLGFSRPAEQMRVVPGQEILLRDWRAQAMYGEASIVLPIERLIDETHIKHDSVAQDHKLYTLQFDTAEIIYVDGVEMVAGQDVEIAAEQVQAVYA